jgi:hypothetical protein
MGVDPTDDGNRRATLARSVASAAGLSPKETPGSAAPPRGGCALIGTVRDLTYFSAFLRRESASPPTSSRYNRGRFHRQGRRVSPPASGVPRTPGSGTRTPGRPAPIALLCRPSDRSEDSYRGSPCAVRFVPASGGTTRTRSVTWGTDRCTAIRCLISEPGSCRAFGASFRCTRYPECNSGPPRCTDPFRMRHGGPAALLSASIGMGQLVVKCGAKGCDEGRAGWSVRGTRDHFCSRK